MSATRTSIWNKDFELGPVQAAVVFAVIGAVIGVLFSQMDASWPLEVAFQAVLGFGFGANFGQHRIRSAAEPSCSAATCLLFVAILNAMLFVPILCIWGPKTALFAVAIFGGLCGLTSVIIGYWLLLRRLFMVPRAKVESDTSGNGDVPAD